jgi:Flp pilus assembly protein TadB
MSTITMPTPADVAATTSAAIRSLTDEQIVAIMHSSQKTQRRVLPNCWDTVKTAAPDLALALDDLHAIETSKDLPRFEALAADHERQIGKAVKSGAGKGTAALVMAGAVIGALTAVLGLAGIGMPFVAGGSALAGALLLSGYATGNRLARRNGNWLVADPGAAASIVWDAGIDAAAATALKGRAGQDGLTPDVLRALSSVWTRAGLDPGALTPGRA